MKSLIVAKITVISLILGVSPGVYPQEGAETGTPSPYVETETIQSQVAESLGFKNLSEGEKEGYNKGIRGNVFRGSRYRKHKGMMKALIFESLSDEDKQALIELKKTDPDKFKEVLEDKVASQREYLKKLKETDPQSYKEIELRAHNRMRGRLEKLHKRNPEKFGKLMSWRGKERRKRMKEFCEQDNDECRKIKENHSQRIKDMLGQLKQDDPDTYENIREWIQQKKDNLEASEQ